MKKIIQITNKKGLLLQQQPKKIKLFLLPKDEADEKQTEAAAKMTARELQRKTLEDRIQARKNEVQNSKFVEQDLELKNLKYNF